MAKYLDIKISTYDAVLLHNELDRSVVGYKESGGRTSLECQGPSVQSPVLRVNCATNGADATSMKLFTDSRSKDHSEVTLSCRKEEVSR